MSSDPQTREPDYWWECEAGEVQVGDVILWADRTVSVIGRSRGVSKFNPHARPGVILTVESDDVPPRPLHYYADERVRWRAAS